MGLNGNAVALLDGGSDGHRPRPATDALALEVAVRQFAIHELRVVGGDIDVGRIELPQLVYIGKQFRSSRAFQRWQYLKREPSCCLILMNKFSYAH